MWACCAALTTFGLSSCGNGEQAGHESDTQATETHAQPEAHGHPTPTLQSGEANHDGDAGPAGEAGSNHGDAHGGPDSYGARNAEANPEVIIDPAADENAQNTLQPRETSVKMENTGRELNQISNEVKVEAVESADAAKKELRTSAKQLEQKVEATEEKIMRK